MAAAVAQPSPAARNFTPEEVAARALELARPVGSTGDWQDCVRWVNALTDALRSESSFERRSAEFALAHVHRELARRNVADAG